MRKLLYIDGAWVEPEGAAGAGAVAEAGAYSPLFLPIAENALRRLRQQVLLMSFVLMTLR